MKKILSAFASLPLVIGAQSAFADQPLPWQMTLQPAATQIMSDIIWFERYTLWFIVPITLFVMLLLAWAMFRYRASANPNPSRTTHNSLIEVIWTVGPVVLLLFLAIPSFQLLTAQYTPPEDPALTIKATGVQWNWDYEYQDEGGLSFSTFLLPDRDREAAGKSDLAVYPRLLTVDNEVVVPLNTTVRVLVTAADVLHAFAMPSFGIKVDAVPGRLNEVWFKAEREGLFYGQCSELCGKDHAFMPIAIRVVSQDQYTTWRATAQADLGGAYKNLMASVSGQDKKLADAGN